MGGCNEGEYIENKRGGSFKRRENMSEGQTDQCEEQPTEPTIKEVCFDVRGEIESLKRRVICLKDNSVFKSEAHEDEDRGEMKANIMLAYRHLEDARMRLGKVVQASAGGKSVYPK